MKERQKKLPQIDAACDHDRSLEFAIHLLDDLLRKHTLDEISSHTGISRRQLSYMRKDGITTYYFQLVMEVLADRVVLVHR